MSDAELMPQTKEQIGTRIEFERLFSEVCAARAALGLSEDEDESDEAIDARLERYNDAEMTFVIKPAPRPRGVWQKWEILERCVMEEVVNGERYDHRVFIIIAAIKADLLRFIESGEAAR
jgi:hypothetical protein